MLTLLISDLHLDDAHPALVARFQQFCEGPARKAEALFILGDLFEYWIGDDDLDGAQSIGHRVAGHLRHLSHAGTAVWLMHGNRDFLLGERFCSAAGARLLRDPTLVTLHGVPTLLSHGDALCTDDQPYQQFRRTVREPRWQQDFLSRPLETRRAEVVAMRERSEREKAVKAAEMMDVSADAVSGWLQAHGPKRLIHGHTHRPHRHEHVLDGMTVERWVLPDWRPDSAGYLACTAEGCRLESLPV